jgi:hypothetical protein
MYDTGEITIKTALKLFTALRNGVYWCDGNEHEAVRSIFNCRCGNCLKKMKPGEKFFDIDDSPSGVVENSDDILRNYKEDYAIVSSLVRNFDPEKSPKSIMLR